MKYANRVKETSTTQGTGTINLAGPSTGFQSFVSGIGTGQKTSYFIEDGNDWEAGIGTVTSGTPDTLSRDTVLSSSNANALVDWGPGTRNVFVGAPSRLIPWRDENLNLVIGYAAATAGTANAQTITLDPAPLALSDGMIFVWRSYGNVTGSATLNANSKGAKTLKWNSANLANGAFNTGDLMAGIYNSATGFIDLITPPRYASRPSFPDAGALTIASDVITVTGSAHTVRTQSAASTDDLVTINGGSDGAVVILRPGSGSEEIVFKNSGNITTPDGNDLKISGTAVSVTLRYDSTLTKWIVLSVAKISSSALTLHLQDQKTSGSDGGTATSGSWQTRVLNTEVYDTIGSTLSSNTFTLPAGTYRIDACAPAYYVGGHIARLYNVTDSAAVLMGTSEYSSNGVDNTTSKSFVRGVFTISAQKTFRLEHNFATTRATNGLGVGNSLGTQIYSDVLITKLA